MKARGAANPCRSSRKDNIRHDQMEGAASRRNHMTRLREAQISDPKKTRGAAAPLWPEIRPHSGEADQRHSDGTYLALVLVQAQVMAPLGTVLTTRAGEGVRVMVTLPARADVVTVMTPFVPLIDSDDRLVDEPGAE